MIPNRRIGGNRMGVRVLLDRAIARRGVGQNWNWWLHAPCGSVQVQVEGRLKSAVEKVNIEIWDYFILDEAGKGGGRCGWEGVGCGWEWEGEGKGKREGGKGRGNTLTTSLLESGRISKIVRIEGKRKNGLQKQIHSTTTPPPLFASK